MTMTKTTNHSRASCFITSRVTSRPHRLKKTTNMQSKRRDLHHTWLHRETNEKLSFYHRKFLRGRRKKRQAIKYIPWEVTKAFNIFYFVSKYFAQPQGDGLGLNVLSWEVKYWFLLSVGNKNPFIVLNRELCNIQGYSNWPAAIH